MWQDIKVQPDNYILNRLMAEKLISDHDLPGALRYAEASNREFPSAEDYDNLGFIDFGLKRYLDSANAYIKALEWGNVEKYYIGAARAMCFVGANQYESDFVHSALNAYPASASLWEYLAILQYKMGNTDEAKTSIATAYSLSQQPEIAALRDIIENGRHLTLTSGQ